MKKISIITMLLMLSAVSGLAQNNKNILPESSLNIRWSPYNLIKPFDTPNNLEVGYSRKIGSKLFLTVDLYAQVTLQIKT